MIEIYSKVREEDRNDDELGWGGGASVAHGVRSECRKRSVIWRLAERALEYWHWLSNKKFLFYSSGIFPLWFIATIGPIDI